MSEPNSEPKPLNIGFVLFPNLTQLDLTGPLQVLGRAPEANVHLAAASMEPVASDGALKLVPTTTFTDCPDLDVLCVPGGFGVDAAMAEPALMDFVRRQSACARYVTSVCTGAFILGAAGLLRGKRATTHWAYHDELARVGAIPERARVVRDGNIITGGGVTAGIDFGLTLLAELAGADYARLVQLSLEYDPGPPFDAGAVEKAPASVSAEAQARYQPRVAAFREALEIALAKAG